MHPARTDRDRHPSHRLQSWDAAIVFPERAPAGQGRDTDRFTRHTLPDPPHTLRLPRRPDATSRPTRPLHNPPGPGGPAPGTPPATVARAHHTCGPATLPADGSFQCRETAPSPYRSVSPATTQTGRHGVPHCRAATLHAYTRAQHHNPASPADPHQPAAADAATAGTPPPTPHPPNPQPVNK